MDGIRFVWNLNAVHFLIDSHVGWTRDIIQQSLWLDAGNCDERKRITKKVGMRDEQEEG